MREPEVPNEHETVGAYALGILDDAEATAFERHLAGCDWCARQLDELAGLEPMLAALAGFPAGTAGAADGAASGAGTPALGEASVARPAPRLAEKLADEVAARRARKKRRNLYLVSTAAALIVGGPFAAVATTSGDGGGGGGRTTQAGPGSAAQEAFDDMPDRVSATDPGTEVSATVALEKKAWGTHAVLQLSNVKGPEKCALVAVGKNGERETVTSWSVPEWGYGIPDAATDKAKQPLYVHGGAAFQPNQIDHFEVMTFGGERLVEVDA